MNPIHSLSAITPLPEFDLWGVPPTQLTVERVFDVEYRPITAVDATSPIIFSFSSANDEYVKLDEIFLSWNVQLEFVKEGGAIDIQDYTKFNFMSYAMHSMIKQIELEINNKQISNLPQNYAYRAFLEALLGFSKNAKKTHLTTALWDDTFKTPIVASPDLKKSKVYHMMGKLHTDLAFQGRYLIEGCNLKLEISLNPPKFYLKLGDKVSAILHISDVSLHVQKAKVSKETVEAHQKALEILPVKYPITRVEVKKVVLPKGINDIYVENFIYSQIPRRMFVFLVDNEAFSGSYSKDPFYFQPFNINHICAFIDGVSYPSQPYQPDFDQEKYMREYLGLFDALNQNGTDVMCNIEKNIYKSNEAIFLFQFFF